MCIALVTLHITTPGGRVFFVVHTHNTLIHLLSLLLTQHTHTLIIITPYTTHSYTFYHHSLHNTLAYNDSLHNTHSYLTQTHVRAEWPSRPSHLAADVLSSRPVHPPRWPLQLATAASALRVRSHPLPRTHFIAALPPAGPCACLGHQEQGWWCRCWYWRQAGGGCQVQRCCTLLCQLLQVRVCIIG